MTKAVIFDMDGVLLDSFEANLDFFQRLFVRAGYPAITREQYLKEGFHRSMVDVIKNHIGEVSDEEVERIMDLRRNREVTHDVSLLKFPAGLDEVVKKLSKKYRLAIATSRVREGVFRSPRIEVLKEYFSATVAYEDTENHKPHPDPLILAAQKLNLKPEECVYVGDAQTDLDASRAAGMKCVIYSRVLDGADACTLDFDKLPEIITGL